MIREEVMYRGVSLAELKTVAEEIARLTYGIKVWLFHGELGSGKTTLIKTICQKMGVHEAMSSPTFAIVNEYEAKDYKIFHFDFYRIKTEAEAYDIGTEDYFYSGFPCFIEWPEKIPSLIPPIFAEVSISIENETQRTIAISVHDGKEENRV